jgi:hypothetical protein
VLIQLFISAIVLWHGAPQNSNHYLSALQDKLARLEHCAGRRLIVAGGSNVAFGIHSPTLEQATGLEPVNLGLHASLGLDHPLQCVWQHARRGDVVVLIPEYELLIDDIRQGDPTVIEQLLDQCPSAKRYFDTSRYNGWKYFLDRDALCRSHQWVMRAWDRIRKQDKPENLYQRSSFNSYGDVVAHHGRTIRADIRKTLPAVRGEHLQSAIDSLNRLAGHCRSSGIEVYLAFPPLPESTYASSAAELRAVQEALEGGLDMPLLQQPHDVVFPSEDFYDTAYHLGQSAGVKRTRALADALLRARDQPARVAEASDPSPDPSPDRSPSPLLR